MGANGASAFDDMVANHGEELQRLAAPTTEEALEREMRNLFATHKISWTEDQARTNVARGASEDNAMAPEVGFTPTCMR